MSEEFEGPFPGFPVLFFHEDPEEKRQRIEGARPPPESVQVPRLVDSAEPEPQALEYALLKFPWEPWARGTETQSLASQYAGWLNEVAAERQAQFGSLLEAAGAPLRADGQEPADLAALGAWAQQWLATLALPFVRQGFIQLHARNRLGSASFTRSAQSQGYSRAVDALIGSLAHDFAFIVADSVRRDRPELTWRFAFDTEHRRFLVTIGTDQQAFDIIEQLIDYVVQSAARHRGALGKELRRWYGLALQRCRDRVVSGAPVADPSKVFPDFRSRFNYPRRSVSRPTRTDPPAPAELTEAAERFQRAGWFESIKLGPADLARALQSAWRRYEGEDITSDSAHPHSRILLLDGGRTWSEDVDAGIEHGDRIYGAVAECLSHVGLKAIRSLHNTEEDWASRPGELLLTLTAMRGQPEVAIPSPTPYISAALFTGLNQLLPDEGPRLWFFDHGSPLGIVTRATQAERDALENLTGITLHRDPPGWWAALAPIPEYPALRPGHASAQPPEPVSARKDSGRGTPANLRRAGGGSRASKAGGTPTAQQAFADMMRNIIAPALRDLGFKGSVTRGFRCTNGVYTGGFWTQKSRYSTKEKVEFWVHLSAVHEPTGSSYWNMQLHALIPRNESFSHWTVRAGRPVEPVAANLLRVFRRYGWTAIQAAIDSPGYPPDPDITWARSFPAEPTPAASAASQPNFGPGLTWLVHRATHQDDDVFADLADSDAIVRTEAAVTIGLEELGDSRAVPALLNRLEFDPSANVRERAALALGRAADRSEVRDAFRAAAAQDEDVQVRWAARYGLRLAGNLGGSRIE